MTIAAPTPAGVTGNHVGDKPVLLAVSYLRVSTREQAERGGTEEGFSIPAQREANQRKADELGARIVHEFVDAGESARSADRDGLQDMLAFITTARVQFCIVHKLDRLARNRADDVKIHEALISAGVTLVSATESIDQTPSGMLVHGIISSIAEFYSRNLATEVTKGLTQKVAQGGTPMRAPIGYLNVRRADDQGREIRTVEVDPERAPLIRWAFEHYAEGRDFRDRATVRPHRTRAAHGADAEAPVQAVGEEHALQVADEPLLRGRDPLQGCPTSGRARTAHRPGLVRHGAVAAAGADGEDDPACSARAPPERAAALRHLRIANAARLRHQPPRCHLRLLRLLRQSREEDQLHTAGGARRGRRAPRRGLLRLDHDQRRDLPRPRRQGRCRVRQADGRPRPRDSRPHGQPDEARSRE
ncbi:hypothetical protein BN12_110004 [Nostocoides japonicum T1-X7]|uniref:Resolvase/invertase-type recombinase catalytic domain-containing protein n=1 Tax=Nostocoides japonicum T1-X7 TaxID=1194083 RepID=A0A077LSQ7_9MICO|nr:hypothetical protein BN12_110004 [Tetrasphaera japonica T1-X7]